MVKRVRRKKVSSKLASRVKSLESMVGKTIENKVVDFQNHATTPQPIPPAGLSYLAFARGLNVDTANGATGSSRVGNKVTLMSQTFRGYIRAPAGIADEQQNQVRLLIVENVGFTGATDLLIGDVLQYGDLATDAGQRFISPYKTNAITTKRYRVIMDRIITFNKTDKGYYHFKKRISYGTKSNPGKVLTFSSPLDQFPNNHRLNLFVLSDSGVANHPDIMFNVRNVYKDS